MFNDLELTFSTVNWVRNSLPSLKERFNEWLNSHYKTKEVELSGNPTHNLLVAYEAKSFPLAYSVEFGAYLNVLRSALDILACTLAARHGVTEFDDIYFPVARNANNWVTANPRRDMFLRLLTPDERAVIDSLKPYKGGDPDIWPLHRLDIERKHRRLLVVEPKPAMFAIRDFGNEDIIDIKAPFGTIGASGETALCFVRKDRGRRDMVLTGDVMVDEPGIPIKAEAISLLEQFSNKVREIVLEFQL
jgi:hypothetical protein